jgi:hypothetical protein
VIDSMMKPRKLERGQATLANLFYSDLIDDSES